MDKTLLQQFEAVAIPPADFGHMDHLKVAFVMLEQYEFLDSCNRYAKTIKAMAESVGALKKFNTTITFAFMSIIAERKLGFAGSFEEFLNAYPELLDKNLLSNLYSQERLHSDQARQNFLLPDKAA